MKLSRVLLPVLLLTSLALVGGAQEPATWSGNPISMSLKEAPLPDVLGGVAKLSGRRLAVEVGFDLPGSVTVQFEKIPWDQALHEIAVSNDFQVYLLGDFIVAARANGQVGFVRP